MSKEAKRFLIKTGVTAAAVWYIGSIIRTVDRIADATTRFVTDPLINTTNQLLGFPLNGVGTGEVHMTIGFFGAAIATRLIKSKAESFNPGWPSLLCLIPATLVWLQGPLAGVPNSLTGLSLSGTQADAACMMLGAASGVVAGLLRKYDKTAG